MTYVAARCIGILGMDLLTPVDTAGREIVADACAFIEAQAATPSLQRLAERSGQPAARFLRLFCDHTGVTPRSFAEAVQARRAHAATDKPLAADAERIRTAFIDTQFGRLLVGASDRGVCFLGFAEADEALMGDLHRRFPNARKSPDPASLAAPMAAVQAYLAQPARGLTLPLDLRGTPFQRRVWAALCEIPPGQTRTYGQLATMIGAPRAIRAVARSCATNPVSLAVPCHRIVGSDGALTGYRWGLPRKRALLEREAA